MSIYLNKVDKTKILWLLRDSQQSTLKDLDWGMSGQTMIDLISAGVAAGIPATEVGGGRFWEIAQLQRKNPFRLINKARETINQRDVRAQPMQLSVLVRGSNGMGFDHVDISVQEQLIAQHAQAGINIFRIFDALNDIDNINQFDLAPEVAKKVYMQGALAYTTDGVLQADETPIYTVDYYVNYARKMLEKGFTSLCIKDMAGQLKADQVTPLVGRLKSAFPDVPLTLHVHSTNEKQSFETIEAAIEAGICGIELGLPPLHRGAAHHDIHDFNHHVKVESLDEQGISLLKQTFSEYFGAKERVDVLISEDVRNKFCAAGIPGGAIPAIMAMLQAQFRQEFSGDNPQIHEFLDTYLSFVGRVRRDAGRPPLVTPSADIVCRQAVFAFSLNRSITDPNRLSISEMYSTMTPDFAKLLLGHFGFIRCYGEETDQRVISKPNAEAIELASSKTFGTQAESFLDLWSEAAQEQGVEHITDLSKKTFQDYVAEVEAFVFRASERLSEHLGRNLAHQVVENLIYRFACKDQIALFLAMPPKGKDAEFIWWDLILSDFKVSGQNTKTINLNDEDQIDLIKTMYGSQCLLEAWKSNSSDLYTLVNFLPSVIENFKHQLEQLQEQIDEARGAVEFTRKSSWMYRQPTHLGKVYQLQALKEGMESEMEFCRNISTESVLAQNPDASIILKGFVYPIVWKYIENL